MTLRTQPHPLAVADTRPALTQLLEAASQVILGQEGAIKLAVCCVLAEGHLLIEDVPGVGKTTLAQTIARLSGLAFHRLQFTSDMLPADIVGTAIFDRDNQCFRPHLGPIFTNLLLADEINRASPRTQSALLEAMEERQVSLEGESHPLPTPFVVIATQNSREQVGTYPLPESQLDRFLLRISLGYPSAAAERRLLQGQDRRAVLHDLNPVLDGARLKQLQNQAANVHVAEALLDYVQRILTQSRSGGLFVHGLSPRAGLALLRAAKSWALLGNRRHVLPDDLQAVLPSVIGHRLQARDPGVTGAHAAQQLIEAVAIP